MNKDARPAPFLVTEETIADGNNEYKPKPGENGTRYELAPDVVVRIKRITPALVDRWNSARKDPEDTDDDRTPLQVAIDRAKISTDGCPEEFDWANDGAALVIWRIFEDFLFLSNPTLMQRTQSLMLSPDQQTTPG